MLKEERAVTGFSPLFVSKTICKKEEERKKKRRKKRNCLLLLAAEKRTLAANWISAGVAGRREEGGLGPLLRGEEEAEGLLLEEMEEIKERKREKMLVLGRRRGNREERKDG